MSKPKKKKSAVPDIQIGWEKAFDALEDGVALLDTQSRFLECNKAMQKITGKKKKDLIGFKCHEIMHSSSRPIKNCPFVRMKRSLKRETEVLNISDAWLQVTVDPVFNVKKKLSGAVHIISDITEKKRAEDALKRVKIKIEKDLLIKDAVFESSITANSTADPEGNINLANKSFLRQWGYKSKKEVIGKPLSVFFKNKKDVGFILESLQKTGKWEGVFLGKRKDGSAFYSRGRATAIIDEKGRLIGYQSVNIDVTDQIRMEKEINKHRDDLEQLVKERTADLIESEARLLEAAEIAKLAYWEYDVLKDEFTFNDQFFGVYRTNVRKAGSYTISSQEYAERFVHPDDMHMVGEEVKKLLETKDPDYTSRVEHRIIYGDGTTGYISVNFFVIHDSKGRTIKTFGVNQDITEKKISEDALRESEKKYSSVVENSNEGILIHSGGIIRFVNKACLEITGYTENELVANDMLVFITPEYKDVVAKNFADRIAGKKAPDIYEIDIKKKDGSVIPIELRVTAMEYNKEPGALIFFRDISEQKKAEKEKERLQAQLFQSQKMEAIGSLAGGIAHDFNNILTAINGYCQLILPQVKDNPVVTHDIKEIKNAAKRAASMTHQLLAFSRKQVLSSQILDINTVIIEMEKMLKRLIGEDIKLVTDLDPDLNETKTDLSQFEQVIMNLAVNARDAMPEGGTLSIITKNEYITEKECESLTDVKSGRFIRVTIHDTGTGMDTETADRIFEPFFSTKPMGKGTGLGLSMVHGIIHQQKGFISVFSAPGEGTAFNIFIPVIETKGKYKKKKSDTFVKYAGNGEHILLVEDEKGTRDVGVRILFEAGYKVIEAEDAETALDIFEKNKDSIDLVLSDVVLPGMSGLDLVEMVMEEKPDIGVILCSGYTDERSRIEKIEAKGYKFVQKPYEIDELLKTISNVLMNRDK